MQLTIIPSDGAVYENGVSYTNLVWNGTPANVHALQFNTDTNVGWIEYTDGSPNEDINVLPQWALNAEAAWNVANNPPVEPPTAEQNKLMAISKLGSTDWAATVDISDPAYSNPYLMNQVDFLNYRSQIRQIAVNPTPGYIDWPVEPTAVWS